jgi:hypothetical protein
MDGEPLRWLYHRLLHDPTLTRTRDCTYGDGIVCFVYFLAVLGGRSLRWAADKRNWPAWCRRLVAIPCHQQLCKRLKTASVAAAIEAVNDELRDRLPRGNEKVVDGKALVVGGYTHDPDAAACGQVPGGFAHGYRLHAIVDARCGAIDAFAVTSLGGDGTGEATVLRQALLPRVELGGGGGGCTLRGDANYDSNPCYAAVAAAGGRMIATRRKPGTGLGHGTDQHPDRLRAIEELERSPQAAALLASHKRLRNRAEQAFALLTNLPFGLGPLPNHVRRLPRVRMWVQAKITLYHLHKVLSRPAAAAA